jgi:hypothetical protein
MTVIPFLACPLHEETGFGAAPFPRPVDTRGILSRGEGVKQPKHDAGHSHPFIYCLLSRLGMYGYVPLFSHTTSWCGVFLAQGQMYLNASYIPGEV